MATSLQALILNDYPVPFFLAAESLLAAVALGPLPSFVPLVLLLSVLMIHGQRIVCRRTRWWELFCSWLCATAGLTIAHWGAAITAVSSPAESLFAIVTLSALTYFFVVVPAICIDTFFKRRLPTDWAQLTFFPVIWATCWTISSRISPVGRLLNWTPSPVPSAYSWILPIAGPFAIDWIVAAWAVVCSELLAQWFMGLSEWEPEDNQPLISSRSTALSILTIALLLLTFPSTFTQYSLPRAEVEHHTPLTVSCVLPTPWDGSHPTLDDYIAETQRMNTANVIIWPESAVVFNSESEREDAFTRIRGLPLSAVIGVAFDEYVVGDPAHTRNGFALIQKYQEPGEEVVQYYKRNLVPLTESFSKIASRDPPVVSRWELGNPKGMRKPDWAPAPNYTRPLFITSSICLDFASPTAFTDLHSRPSLIMGPARTWQTTVGLAMWEQAKTRAKELGSMILWCDGGSTGVSGIAGAGIQDPMQIGGGTWTRTVGIRYPFDERRTAYAVGGDFSVMVFLVVLMGGGICVEMVQKLVREGPAALGRLAIVGRFIPRREGDDVIRSTTRQSHALDSLKARVGLPFLSPPQVPYRWRTESITTSNFIHSKLPRGLRGSLRTSAHSFDPARFLARAFPLFGKKQPQHKQPEDQTQDQDFELIAPDDVPPVAEEDIVLAEPSITPPSLPRPKSTLFRLKNISKASIHLSSFTDSRSSSSRTRTATDESDLCLAFPKPPTHIPTPDTSVPGASIHFNSPTHRRDSSALDASTSSSLKCDPFAADSPLPLLPDQLHSEQASVSPPSVSPSTSSHHSSKLVKPRRRFTGSLKRFKSLSQILIDSFVPHPIDASSTDTIRSKRRWNHRRDFDSTVSSDPLHLPVPSVSPVPELCSPSFTTREVDTRSSPPASITSLPEESSPTPIPIPPPLRRKHSAPAELGSPITHYQLVNPSELTASPLVRSSVINSSARSSCLLPSPSWLSRNVTHFDPSEISATFPPSRISALSNSDHLKITEVTTFYPSALFAPNSPRPLPIPPPIIPVPPPQLRQPTTSSSRPILQPLVTNVSPESPDSDTGSFVTSPTPLESTLYSPTSSTTPTTAFASALPSPSPQFRRRLSNTSISQISVERHRQSIARLKKSRTSSPRTLRQPSFKASRTSFNPAHKDPSTRNHLSNGPKFPLVKAPPSPATCESSDQRTIFIPSKQPESKQSPLPKDLALLLEAFFTQSGILNSFSRPTMDYTGKNHDVVDFGGEVDYSGHQWFQEPPPRPEPLPVVEPYIPDDDVIKQNEAFDFALKAAPNVLYGRFKQYGQLGVLAWCSEFSEMIDSLKELGFSGNMFVATRAQALRTCEEILKLKLDIKMQIVLMYLSSQVARLRRFLDSGERQWEDYPVPEFPLDYRAYS